MANLWVSLRKSQTLTRPTCLALWADKRHRGSTQASAGEYLQRSVVPTMHYQEGIPRLPIPKLADSIQRYLAAQRPLLDDDKFRNTEKLAHDFLNGVGKQLHEEVVARDKINKHVSYITEPWLDMYLCGRNSLLYSCPYMSFRPDPRKEYNDQLVRATNLVCSVVRFMKTLRAGLLEPDVLHLNPAKSNTDRFKRFIRWVPSSLSCYIANMVNAYPLDMSQFCRMFNSTRIPKRGRDELFTDEEGRHVLVMRKGNMYVFDVVDRDGNLVKPAEIQSHLKYILCDPAPVPDFPLGVLTTENRDVWADLREKLTAAGNTDNLWMVDSALFCLCLDDASMKDCVHISQNMLHGDGCNRWYEKSFSIILAQDGQAGINLEHSWGDGKTVIRILNEVFKDSTEQPQVHPGSAAAAVDSASAVRRLDFRMDRELEDGIKRAKENFDLTVSKLVTEILDFGKGGKGQLKRSNVSPDAMMQLALQMAFLRQYGKIESIYESCSCVRFKCGRLETMYTASIHTKQCSHAFVCQPGQHSVGQLKAMLHECSKYHRKLINDASMGRGFDSHMLALYHMATSKGQDMPCLFTDPAYLALCYASLSTSTVPSPFLGIAIAAPDTPGGINVTYCFHEHQIISSVTSNPSRNSHEFVQCVHHCLEDIFTVLAGKPLC